MTRRTGIVTLLLVTGVACGGVAAARWMKDPERILQRELKMDYEQLAKEIEGADSVVLIEHSHPTDEVRKSDGDLPADWPPKYEYSRINLDVGRRQGLVVAVRSVEPDPKRPITLCLPVPHHTVLVTKGDDVRRLQVCFSCGQVRWNENQNGRFDKLAKPLGSWMRSMGMDPDADWRERYVEASMVKTQ